MTTLTARFVRQPRTRYVCDWCAKPIIGPYIRLYGRAHDCDPMTTLRLHPNEQCCPSAVRDPKIAAALAKVSKP